MSWLRAFLVFSVVVWLPYGLYCFAVPGFLEGAAGVAASSTTGTVELRAMYGGLQAAIGAFAGAALLRPSLARPALLAIGFLCAGLATARLGGAALAGEVSGYTAGGLGFEIFSATAARLLLARGAGAPAA